MTCPRRIRGNQVIESFCNSGSGHRDSSDCIDDEQGVIVHDYAKTMNSPILNDYLERMYAMFDDRLRQPRVPLPTTCAWKMVELEQPELYGYNSVLMRSFALIAEGWRAATPLSRVAWPAKRTSTRIDPPKGHLLTYSRIYVWWYLLYDIWK